MFTLWRLRPVVTGNHCVPEVVCYSNSPACSARHPCRVAFVPVFAALARISRHSLHEQILRQNGRNLTTAYPSLFHKISDDIMTVLHEQFRKSVNDLVISAC